ncbi:MAG: TonB family protein [Bernardetiaceae bacterium]|jgi:protein TonB|nr:TonB family protein [Bernardetiaceae bacterium]
MEKQKRNLIGQFIGGLIGRPVALGFIGAVLLAAVGCKDTQPAEQVQEETAPVVAVENPAPPVTTTSGQGKPAVKEEKPVEQPVKKEKVAKEEPKVKEEPKKVEKAEKVEKKPEPKKAEEDEVVILADVGAEPEGGYEAYYKYIKQNLKYPEEAKKQQAVGKVLLKMVVKKDGSLSDIKVEKGIGYGCDEEAIRVVKAGSPWKAAQNQGKPVSQEVLLPIVFRLN